MQPGHRLNHLFAAPTQPPPSNIWDLVAAVILWESRKKRDSFWILQYSRENNTWKCPWPTPMRVRKQLSTPSLTNFDCM